jgi:hypothetical protein
MPIELREAIGRWLLEPRNSRLRAERETIEARVKGMFPPAEPLTLMRTASANQYS